MLVKHREKLLLSQRRLVFERLKSAFYRLKDVGDHLVLKDEQFFFDQQDALI